MGGRQKERMKKDSNKGETSSGSSKMRMELLVEDKAGGGARKVRMYSFPGNASVLVELKGYVWYNLQD